MSDQLRQAKQDGRPIADAGMVQRELRQKGQDKDGGPGPRRLEPGRTSNDRRVRRPEPGMLRGANRSWEAWIGRSGSLGSGGRELSSWGSSLPGRPRCTIDLQGRMVGSTGRVRYRPNPTDLRLGADTPSAMSKSPTRR